MAGQPVKTSPSGTSTQMWVRCCKVVPGRSARSRRPQLCDGGQLTVRQHAETIDGGAVERLEAGTLRAWAVASHVALAGSRERIDAVNVFPVPDSDTGTNVL